MTEMTKKVLRQLCKDNDLYVTPHVNDKLYAHYRGFNKIQNLEEYTGLRVIWLEGNGLPKIEGLDALTELRTLFLHENIIEKIEGLDKLIELDSVNLSKNFICRIENLSNLKKLTSLNLANNQLQSADDIVHILEVPSLQTLDVQHNRINDVGIVDIVAQLPDLRVLYLQGNPVVKDIKHYRKTIISRCKHLRYLDDRPVFDDERRRVNAWAAAFAEGGFEAAQEAEREEIALIRKEKEEADERSRLAFEKLVREGQAKKKQQQEQNQENDGASVNCSTSPKRNPHSGETIIPIPESEELRKLREKRLAKILEEGDSTEKSTTQVVDKSKKVEEPLSVPEASVLSEEKWIKFSITEDIDSDDNAADEEVVEVSQESSDPTSPTVSSEPVENKEKYVSKFFSLMDEAQQEIQAEATHISLNKDTDSAVCVTENVTDLYELD